MENALSDLIDTVATYETKRMENFENFKNNVSELVGLYYNNRFKEQVEEISEMKEENKRKFEELVPQMEAIHQIRNIYQQTLSRRS